MFTSISPTNVKNSVKWFNDNTFNNKIEGTHVKESFEKAGFNADEAEIRTACILKSTELLQGNSIKWQRKLYTFGKKNNKLSVAFHNDHYYIDCYGNCFMTENEFLQYLSHFSKNLQFKSHYGVRFNIKKTVSVEIIMQILSNAFRKVLGRYNIAFSSFINDCECSQVLEVIKKIKPHFLFFYALDKKIGEASEHVTFALNSNKFHILFSNLRYYVMDLKEESYENLEKTNLDTPIKDVPYDECMIHLGFKNYEKTTEFWVLEKQTNNRHNFKDLNYRNLCCFVAIKLFKYLKKEKPELCCTKVTEFKSMFFWCDAKFEDGIYTAAKKQFQKDEIQIKKEYCELLKLTGKNKSKNHPFSHFFTAAYHFQEHYDAIAVILTAFGQKKYIKSSAARLEGCVKLYLDDLTQYMFNAGDFCYEEDTNQSPYSVKKRQNYCFLKNDDMIKGMKYKFMDTFEKKSRGNVARDIKNLEGTTTSTIHENI